MKILNFQSHCEINVNGNALKNNCMFINLKKNVKSHC